jgi:hypothetical protein
LVRRINDRFTVALGKFEVGQGSLAGPDLAALVAWWNEGVSRRAPVAPGTVPALVSSHLCGEIDLAWERGWQPADAHRIVRQRMSANHVHLVVAAIAENAQVYRLRQCVLPAWLEQLDEIGATLRSDPASDHLARLAEERNLSRETLLQTAFELIVMLHRLPPIPLLVPPPSQWDHSAALDAAVAWQREARRSEVRHLEQIRALLAKAESTEFPEEADAFTSKAQELMTRHAIDDVVLAPHSAGRSSADRPSATRIGIDDPYAQVKAILLDLIAQASHCRAVWSKGLGFSTVFGYPGDLASVELLYASLLLQARNAMVRIGDHGKRARSRPFRRSFLLGFAIRIGKRLEEAASAAVADAVEERGSEFLPVLATRSSQVDELREEVFPNLIESRFTTGDLSGWASVSRQPMQPSSRAGRRSRQRHLPEVQAGSHIPQRKNSGRVPFYRGLLRPLSFITSSNLSQRMRYRVRPFPGSQSTVPLLT